MFAEENAALELEIGRNQFGLQSCALQQLDQVVLAKNLRSNTPSATYRNELEVRIFPSVNTFRKFGMLITTLPASDSRSRDVSARTAHGSSRCLQYVRKNEQVERTILRQPGPYVFDRARIKLVDHALGWYQAIWIEANHHLRQSFTL